MHIGKLNAGKWEVLLDGNWRNEEELGLDHWQIVEDKFFNKSPIDQVPSGGYTANENYSKSLIQ